MSSTHLYSEKDMIKNNIFTKKYSDNRTHNAVNCL